MPRYPCAHTRFLDVLMPRVEAHAMIVFRDHAADKKADLVAECVALAWKWYMRLEERGKDAARWPAAFASLVARAVKCGRRLSGQAKAKDVLSENAQRRHGFAVSTLPMKSTLTENPFSEALTDNTVSPVPDQVCFRIDFPAWRATRTRRDRRLIDGLGRGERTGDASRRFGLSPARISQVRREFMEDWKSFCA